MLGTTESPEAQALEPLHAAIGVIALITAWGLWRLRPWAIGSAGSCKASSADIGV
ncbi:MAG: hypothetical protein ACLP8S_34120 [Solirubrobacteraceae bacterium]